MKPFVVSIIATFIVLGNRKTIKFGIFFSTLAQCYYMFSPLSREVYYHQGGIFTTFRADSIRAPLMSWRKSKPACLPSFVMFCLTLNTFEFRLLRINFKLRV